MTSSVLEVVAVVAVIVVVAHADGLVGHGDVG